MKTEHMSRALWEEIFRAIDSKVLEMATEKKARKLPEVAKTPQGTAPFAGSPLQEKWPRGDYLDDLTERWEYANNGSHLEFDR
jgi:hypothetical protein